MMLVSIVLTASDFMMPTSTAAKPVAATNTTAYSAVAAPLFGLGRQRPYTSIEQADHAVSLLSQCEHSATHPPQYVGMAIDID